MHRSNLRVRATQRHIWPSSRETAPDRRLEWERSRRLGDSDDTTIFCMFLFLWLNFGGWSQFLMAKSTIHFFVSKFHFSGRTCLRMKQSLSWRDPQYQRRKKLWRLSSQRQGSCDTPTRHFPMLPIPSREKKPTVLQDCYAGDIFVIEATKSWYFLLRCPFNWIEWDFIELAMFLPDSNKPVEIVRDSIFINLHHGTMSCCLLHMFIFVTSTMKRALTYSKQFSYCRAGLVVSGLAQC